VSYKQCCVSAGKFRQYDYGLVKNLLIYGHLSPPDYDLSKVTAPVALHYSENDWLAAITVSGHINSCINSSSWLKSPKERGQVEHLHVKKRIIVLRRILENYTAKLWKDTAVLG
jgi:hypothetical protein